MSWNALAVHSRVTRLGIGLPLALLLAGCNTMSPNEFSGTLIGGTAGAVIGNQFGKGSGNTAATALGAIIGANVGRDIGAALDETSRRRAGQSTIRALDTGSEIVWENPQNAGGPARGSTTITNRGALPDGRVCREYVNTVIIGGREEQSYGTACRDANGDWEQV